jgi:type II secretion system protein H
LIELLVVIAIIGLVAGIVVLSGSGDERRTTEREAKRLAGALEHAAATAQWRAEVLGVSADGAGYRFWRRDTTDRWSALTTDVERMRVRFPRASPLQRLRMRARRSHPMSSFRSARAGATNRSRCRSPPTHGRYRSTPIR